MIPGFIRIVEQRIREAQKKGEFENLEGSGKPLDFAADQAVAELELKKEIRQTEELLAGMSDTAEKYRVMKKLNFLILKLNSLRHASVVFDKPQKYSDKLIKKLESSASKSKKNK